MNNALETRYFLSAMTGAGYYALHRQFLRPAGALFLHPQGRAGLRQVHLPAPRRRRGARRRALGRLAALRGRSGLARRRVFPAKARRLL